MSRARPEGFPSDQHMVHLRLIRSDKTLTRVNILSHRASVNVRFGASSAFRVFRGSVLGPPAVDLAIGLSSDFFET